jgi:mannose-6-phosphate isomerase-like protein (cupin superfamily)
MRRASYDRAVGDWTLKNLKADVDDSAEKFGLAPDLEAHFARGELAMTTAGVSYQRLAPNFRTPFGHRHANQEEVYVVVVGGGRIKLDDEIVELKQWDAVRVAATTTRAVEAGPDGIEFLAYGAPTTGENDSELEQNWWND